MRQKIKDDELDDMSFVDDAYYALVRMGWKRSIIAETYISASTTMRTMKKLQKALEVRTYQSGGQILQIEALEDLLRDDKPVPKE
jgi:hypothetical protein